MKYKALFLDVDGTLVLHGIHNVPTSKVVSAIAKCREQNIAVCLATSRPLYVVQPLIEYLDLTGYCVISSGSQIYDPMTKKIILEKVLPISLVHQIYGIAEKFLSKVAIFNGEHEILYESIASDKVVGLYFPALTVRVLLRIEKELKKISGISLHRMPAWDERFECLTIVHAEATKLHGISEVAKLLNIETHEMIGVGDGYNDYPLLSACGLKIAMGNAVPELKQLPIL